jgi:hypothetical protein
VHNDGKSERRGVEVDGSFDIVDDVANINGHMRLLDLMWLSDWVPCPSSRMAGRQAHTQTPSCKRSVDRRPPEPESLALQLPDLDAADGWLAAFIDARRLPTAADVNPAVQF